MEKNLSHSVNERYDNVWKYYMIRTSIRVGNLPYTLDFSFGWFVFYISTKLNIVKYLQNPKS